MARADGPASVMAAAAASFASLPGDEDDSSPSKTKPTRKSLHEPPADGAGACACGVSSAQEALLVTYSHQAAATPPPPALAPQSPLVPDDQQDCSRSATSSSGRLSGSAGANVGSYSQDLLPLARLHWSADVSSLSAPPPLPLRHLPYRLIPRMCYLLPPGVSPSASKDSQPVGTITPRSSALIAKLSGLLCLGGRSPQLCKEGTSGPAVPHPYMELNVLEQKCLLAIPLMCAVRKMSVIWRIVGSWALLSSLITATGRGLSAFSMLSSRFAEGVFAMRFYTTVLRWFGYEGGPSPRFTDFIGLVSTFFRNVGLTLNTASDLLKNINESRAIAPQPHILPESASSSSDVESEEATDTDVDNADQPGGQVKIVFCVIEGKEAISRWKGGDSHISVHVPPNISLEMAIRLKKIFEEQGAYSLLQGTNIDHILQNALVSAQLVLDNAKIELEEATKRVEELRQLSSPSSGCNRDQ